MNNTYSSLLNGGQYSSSSIGTALTNTTTATDISPGGSAAGQAFTFLANYLQVGQVYRVRTRGIISTTGTPNINIGVYYGGITSGVLLAAANATTQSGMSGIPWSLECDFRVDGVGTNGSIRALGALYNISSVIVPIPSNASLGSGVAVNTTVNTILTIGATWGTANLSNSIQIGLYTIERLNDGGS